MIGTVRVALRKLDSPKAVGGGKPGALFFTAVPGTTSRIWNRAIARLAFQMSAPQFPQMWKMPGYVAALPYMAGIRPSRLGHCFMEPCCMLSAYNSPRANPVRAVLYTSSHSKCLQARLWSRCYCSHVTDEQMGARGG